MVVIFCHRAFSFEDLDQNHILIVSGCREDLRLASRNSRVTSDQRCRNSTSGLNRDERSRNNQHCSTRLGGSIEWISYCTHLDTQTQRSHIHDDSSLISFDTRSDASLNSSSPSHSFIRVDTFEKLFAVEEFFEKFLDLWDTSRASDQNDLVDV